MDQKLNLTSYLELAESLPLKKNDILFIASDLGQLAKDCRARGERFDANAFIESFQSFLSDGTIVIPAYTDNLWNGDTFNYHKSRPTTGALSNKVFRRKDFVRSHDPLHSVFAWGKYAEDIEKLNAESTFGKGSIFDFLYTHKAKMICIDVHFQNSLTFVHYVEEKKGVKYRKFYDLQLKVMDDHGEHDQKIRFHTKKPWILTDLYDLQQSMGAEGIKTNYKFGNVKIQYFELRKAHNYIVDYIHSGRRLYQVDLIHFVKRVIKKIIRKK